MSYGAVQRWLVGHTALEPSLLKGAGFDLLVAERIAASGGGDEAGYVGVLDRSAEEVDRLTAGIAVPETWFFRYPQSYRLLAEFLERRRGAGATSLRMMSVGCASGEEPYGMAMVALHAGWPAGQVRIDAFDGNGEVLRRAEAGVYGASSVRTEIPPWAAEFLDRSGAAVRVDPAVRAMVRFVRLDVTQPGALPTVPQSDVVFCRNLLIYLSEEARGRLLERACLALETGGLLFVGHAEPPLCAGLPLRPVAAPHAFALERAAEDVRGGDRPGADHRPPVRTRREGAGASVESRRAPLVAPPPAAPSPVEPSIGEARDLADAGRAEESEAMVRAVVSRHGPSAEALELLGMIRMAANDTPGAKRCFEQAVYLEPSRTASLLQLAMISESKGDERQAAALWSRARRPSGAGDRGADR